MPTHGLFVSQHVSWSENRVTMGESGVLQIDPDSDHEALRLTWRLKKNGHSKAGI